ncbi:hypothetical protein GCM10010199_59710 [Dactylosporangium roseum]
MTVDPYSDPASEVLRNRFGITDPDRLRVVEADLTAAALADLGTRILPGGYDLIHLRLFHAEIFGDLYPWRVRFELWASPRAIPSACRRCWPG